MSSAPLVREGGGRSVGGSARLIKGLRGVATACLLPLVISQCQAVGVNWPHGAASAKEG